MIPLSLNRGMRIVASMTTIPGRLNKTRPVIESILSQTIPIDHLEFNIPYHCIRTGEIYTIPEWLQNLPKVKIHRTEDYGAITKVAPTLLRHKNNDTYIWSVDDDFQYPCNTLATLFRAHNPSIYRILCLQGAFWNNARGDGYHGTINEGPVHFIEGFGSVLYPPKCIKDDFENYVVTTSKDMDCRKSDDIILSNYFAKYEITMYTCFNPERVDIHSKAMPYYKDSNALHLQDTGHSERYARVYKHLEANNLIGWTHTLEMAQFHTSIVPTGRGRRKA
jgi:hypothetical protein